MDDDLSQPVRAAELQAALARGSSVITEFSRRCWLAGRSIGLNVEISQFSNRAVGHDRFI
jgi:hypothetical protein